ncbi:glycosyltransferase family 4 protein [Sphingomonas sp. dw_22]|uniref:glycosyltransferase family 4 protein n=1 Tax=Sphingomonas sp. dw_22 TaxID=2721175 RepID=UPI001BD206E8|nr:glycosyltransferase family 4 protein [Sphingomonas sp. dw_22]
MRILIITQWFQPEPHFKGLGFAKALQAMGHEVEVLTGFPNYPGGRVYPGYRIRLRQHEIIDDIPITRGYLYPSHDNSALRRIANYASFAISSTLLALFIRKPDVVYVYTPPMTAALPAIALRFLRGVPFVPDVQDLWPDTLAATGMLNDPRLLGLIRWWTDFSLRRASRIIVLSEGFRRRLQERGVKTPITVIWNWAPSEIADIAHRLQPVLPDKTGPFDILFAGNMGKAQGLDIVLKAAAALQEEGAHVRFTMVGGGIEREVLRQHAKDLSLNNIAFHEPRPPSQMGELFEAADALLVHLRDDPLFEITIPSKTQAYLAIGRPILMGVRGDAAAMVEEAGAGLTFAPDDVDAFLAAIKTLLAMTQAERMAMGSAGAAYYRKRLAFDIGVRALEQSLAGAANKA